MNLTKHGLFVVALVGIGASGWIGYVRFRQEDPPLKLASAPLPTSGPPMNADPLDASHSSPRQVLRADMFTGAEPELPIQPLPAVAHTAESKGPVAPTPKPSPDPLADYLYTGTVAVDGRIAALIEHRKSRAGWYVHEGEPWQNYRILKVNANAITIEVNGERRVLTKSDAINVVPLVAESGKGATGTATEASAKTVLSLISAANSDVISFQLNTLTTPAALSPAEIAKIKEDAFEGRISGDEAERRLNPGNAESTTSIPYLLFDLSLSGERAP